VKIRLHHPFLQKSVPALARLLVQGYLRTCPAGVDVAPEVKDLILTGQPVIYTTWHCHLLFPLYFVRRYYPQLPPIVVMASPSGDGEFIAQIARGLGFAVCSGSRRKGGVKALKDMAGYFSQGFSCGLIADGSRGPARVAQKGPLYLARETGALLVPLAVACRRKITFNTWDRFELPLPFGSLKLLVGEPLAVSPQDRGPNLEARRQELEERLNRLFARSRAYPFS
jgi:lysophospholipid acyltransferase (LPLAT)-like uncharacterized protein